MALLTSCFDIRRMMSLLGVQGLMEVMEAQR